MTNSDDQTPYPHQALGAPRRVLAFTGTRTDFVDYLLSLVADQDDRLIDADPAAYEWELTASIARHPAGKGLGRGQA